VAMELQLVIGFVATVFFTAGMVVNKDFQVRASVSPASTSPLPFCGLANAHVEQTADGSHTLCLCASPVHILQKGFPCRVTITTYYPYRSGGSIRLCLVHSSRH
jgi:hypothetical protein